MTECSLWHKLLQWIFSCDTFLPITYETWKARRSTEQVEKRRNANLQHQNLTTMPALLAKQLAGADLTGAKIPDNLGKFTGLDDVKKLCDSTQTIFLSMLAACVYSWLTVWTTTDARLLTNSATSPLPIVQTPIAINSFFRFAPWLLFAIYGFLHFQLERLWEGLAELPAVFPDGRTLHQLVPSWLVTSFVTQYFPQLHDKTRRFAVFQSLIFFLLAWVLVPLTISFFLLRYLPRRDWWSFASLVVCLLVTLWWGASAFSYAKQTLCGSTMSRHRKLDPVSTIVVVIGFLIGGLIFFIIGDHLWHADLQKANLQENNLRNASLRGADLSRANLQKADLEGAQLHEAKLYQANLHEADLRRADLTNADLSGADLSGANLSGANLTEVKNLTQAQLNAACLDEKTRLPKVLTKPASCPP